MDSQTLNKRLLEDSSGFVTFLPQKNKLQIEIKIPQSWDIENEIMISNLGYYKQESRTYIVEVDETEITDKSKVIKYLLEKAYKELYL
jgi:hypothetical protein